MSAATLNYTHDEHLPWDDSLIATSFVQHVIVGMIALFISLTVLTQIWDVPDTRPTVVLTKPPQLAQWLQDSAKPEPVTPEPVKPEIQQPKPVEPKPVQKAPPIKKAEPPKPKPPVPVKPKPVAKKPPPTKPSRAMAKAKAQEHAKALSALATLDLASDLGSFKDSQYSESLNNTAPEPSAPITQTTNLTVANAELDLDHTSVGPQTQAAESISQLSTSQDTAIDPSAYADKPAKPKRTVRPSVAERSQNNIRSTFDSSHASLYSIYRRALRSNPALEGTLVLLLRIDASGAVTNIQVVSSELNDPELENKLMRRIKRLKFGQKNVKPWAGEYAIEFFPTTG